MTREEHINTLELDNAELKKENQELKSQLSGTTHCFDEEEHQRLKAKIAELERIIELSHVNAKETLSEINYEQELQQKEFVKYLEDEINFYKINTQGYSMNLIEEILNKYKEIIQTKNDNSV